MKHQQPITYVNRLFKSSQLSLATLDRKLMQYTWNQEVSLHLTDAVVPL